MVSETDCTGKNSVAWKSLWPKQVGVILGLTSRGGWPLFLIIFLTLIISPIGSNGFAKDKKKSPKKGVEIEYGYPDQSIFVATLNDKGQPDTPMTLVAAALMSRAGLSWHGMPYPARRLFDNLRKGTTNFSILVRASSLTESCIFSKKPIYSTKLNIYHIGDKPAIKSGEDFMGKHIITIRGYSYGGLRAFISDPDSKIINEVASTHKAAFKMLKDNRADYLLDYASAADDILSENPVKNLKTTPIKQLDIFLVLSKSYPDAENLMIKLENIAATLDINAILKSKAK